MMFWQLLCEPPQPAKVAQIATAQTITDTGTQRGNLFSRQSSAIVENITASNRMAANSTSVRDIRPRPAPPVPPPLRAEKAASSAPDDGAGVDGGWPNCLPVVVVV